MGDELTLADERTFPVGYASGVYDMFHVGHLNLLRRARAHCLHLVVGVATDDYVLGLKGRLPVVPFEERFEIIDALGLVDEVVVDESEDKRLAWNRRPFDVIFKGDDWQGQPKGLRLEADLAPLGVEVVYFPYTRHTSSTLLRRHIDQEHAS